jgi:hypothetical protein
MAGAFRWDSERFGGALAPEADRLVGHARDSARGRGDPVNTAR